MCSFNCEDRKLLKKIVAEMNGLTVYVEEFANGKNKRS